MATLEERISALEADIAKNTVRFDKAVDEGNQEDKTLFGNLIISARTELHDLRLQQSQGE
jgi:hypothetical protein